MTTNTYCPACEHKNTTPTESRADSLIHCANCGKAFPLKHGLNAPTIGMKSELVISKKDVQAAVLSAVIPGAGQFYRGNRPAGFVWLAATVIGYFMLIVPGIGLHALCVMNAYKVDHAQLHARNVASTQTVTRKEDN